MYKFLTKFQVSNFFTFKCNMVEIFCTFRDCNDYKLISFCNLTLYQVVLSFCYFAQQFFFQQRVFNLRLWNVTVFIKKQITKPFLEQIFQPTDIKSLRHWNAIQSWYLGFAITVPSSEKLRKQSFTPRRIFSWKRKR